MKTSSNRDGDTDLADAYRGLERAYLRADEPAGLHEALLGAYPDFLPLHLLEIGKLVAAKDAAALAPLRRALASVAPLEAAASAGQCAQLAAARAWLDARPLTAAELYERAVLETPGDLLALRLAQSCRSFLGHRALVRALAERAERAWPRNAPGEDLVLAMHAFGCAETGDGGRAEGLALRALGIEPRSPYAIHSLAHAFAMQERPADGARALEDLARDWRVGGRIDSHNAWHLAVFELEAGDADRALAAYDADLSRSAERSNSACADATDLLWRLELVGVDAGPRWQALSDAWARLLAPGFWGFLDVLAGLAFIRAGHRLRLDDLVWRLRARVGTTGIAMVGQEQNTLLALEALGSFANGTFERVRAAMQVALPHLGGSLPQRRLLELTLGAAQRRALSRRRFGLSRRRRRRQDRSAVDLVTVLEDP